MEQVFSTSMPRQLGVSLTYPAETFALISPSLKTTIPVLGKTSRRSLCVDDDDRDRKGRGVGPGLSVLRLRYGGTKIIVQLGRLGRDGWW